MHQTTDSQLLRSYAESRSEPAFAELVRRHVDFVHTAALRMIRDPHLAEDVTQNTFVALAQNAAQLASHPVLSGWLHRTTRNIAAQTVRTIERRRAREQEAAAMNELLSAAAEPAWENIAPHLDAALGELAEPDRDAVLLRYFEKKSAVEMAAILGISDEAAQKRVNRAVDRLRELFSHRRLAIGAGGLVTLLSAHGISAAPVGLASTITTAALTTTATTSTLVIKTIAMTTLQKTLVAVTVAVLAGTGIYEAHQVAQLRTDNQSIRQHLDQLTADNEKLNASLASASQIFPAPAPVITNPPIAAVAAPTNFWASLTNRTENIKLTHEQAEAFLAANGRTAANLLSAFRTTRDAALLQEAMSKFPNDPQVAFEATQGTKIGSLHLSPAEQRQWLDTFEKDAPNNSLPNYFSAKNYFDNGDIEHGLQELNAAAGKTADDYTASRAEGDTEAYLSAGYAPAEAIQFGTSQLLAPHLAGLKQLGQQAADLAAAYQKAGDTDAAQNALQLADNLGRQFSTPSAGEPTITQLVGIGIEMIALNNMDPNAPYGDTGQTVQQRHDQLVQQRNDVQQTVQKAESLMPDISPQDLITYKNRWLMFGEANAEQWLINKYGQPQQ